MSDYLASPLLSVVLATCVPTFAFSMLNLRFFNKRQVITALGLAGLTGALIYIVIQAIAHFANLNLPPIFWCIIALANLYIWGEKFFSESFSCPKRTKLAAIVMLSLAVLVMTHFISLAVLNSILGLVAASSALDGLRERKRPKDNVIHCTDYKKVYTSDASANIELTHKPNIYLLLLESYHSAKGMKRLYDIDDSVTDELFQKHGFTLYEDVFSNTPFTINSLATLLTGSFLTKAEQNNMVLDTLRANGYGVEFFDSGAYVFGMLAREDEYTSFEYPKSVLWLYSIAGPLFAQSRFLRKAVKNIDVFDTGGDFSVIYNSLSKRVKSKSDKPRIFCAHFGACHFECRLPVWTPDASVFADRYRVEVSKAQKQIHDVVELISANDPDALVIAIGDHGTMRHNNIWSGGGSAEKAIASHNISLEEVALDMFDTRLAIRWPVPHKAEGVAISHINLFRYVFEALGGGEELLHDQAPNISAIGDTLVFVKDGVPLKKLALFHTFGAVSSVGKKIEDGSATVADYLSFARHTVRTSSVRAIDILKAGQRQYPENPDICLELGLILGTLGIKVGLLYLNKAVQLSAFSPDYLFNYLEWLWKFGLFSEAIDLFNNHECLRESHVATKVMLRVYAASGMDDEAEECAKALRKKSTQPPAFACIYLTDSALYFFEKGKNQECIESTRIAMIVGEKINNKYHLLSHLVMQGLILINEGRYQAAEEHFGNICENAEAPGAWSWIMLARMQERNGNGFKALHTLLNAAQKYSQHCNQLLFHAGMTVQRCGITEPNLIRFKIASLEMQRFYCNVFVQNNIISQQDAKAGMNYLHNGVLSGTSPLAWFNPQVYLILNMSIWHSGSDPLSVYVGSPITEFSMQWNALHVGKVEDGKVIKFSDVLEGMNMAYVQSGGELTHRTIATSTYDPAPAFL